MLTWRGGIGLIAVLVALVLTALIVAGVEGLPTPLQLLRLLQAPGHVLQSAPFPRHADLGGPERLALSSGFSVAGHDLKLESLPCKDGGEERYHTLCLDEVKEPTL